MSTIFPARVPPAGFTPGARSKRCWRLQSPSRVHPLCRPPRRGRSQSVLRGLYRGAHPHRSSRHGLARVGKESERRARQLAHRKARDARPPRRRSCSRRLSPIGEFEVKTGLIQTRWTRSCAEVIVQRDVRSASSKGVLLNSKENIKAWMTGLDEMLGSLYQIKI